MGREDVVVAVSYAARDNVARDVRFRTNATATCAEVIAQLSSITQSAI